MKKTFTVLSVICFVFALFFAVCLIGYSFLALLTAVLGGYFLFMAYMPYRFKKFRRCITVLAIIGILLTAVLCGVILSDVRGDADAPCDYVIVLGAGINGETPSLTLQNRLDRTIEYMEKHPESIAIVSGSQGADEDITEARAMERYLLAHGIPAERIIEEEKAENTHENMLYSYDIIKQRGGGSIAVLSSDYHMYRSRRLARNAGFSPVMISAKTSLPVLFLTCFLREAFALVKAHLVFM